MIRNNHPKVHFNAEWRNDVYSEQEVGGAGKEEEEEEEEEGSGSTNRPCWRETVEVLLCLGPRIYSSSR